MNKSWTIKTFKDYLSIPTISAQGKGIKETVKFLTGLFQSIGLKTRIINSGGNPVVYAERIFDPKRKTILFYNHYDVQPPEPLEKWISPPFKPSIRSGKLFARGSSDNKGNLIARISALKSLLENNASLPVHPVRGDVAERNKIKQNLYGITTDTSNGVNIKFLVEGEEEIGSPTLPLFIKKYHSLIKADLCIWESGSRDERDNPNLSLGCKGICHMELVAQGAKSDLHSSKGVIIPNPAWRLIRAINSLKDRDENILISGFNKQVRKPGLIEKKILREIPFYEQEKLRTWGIKSFLKSLTGYALKERYFYEPAINIDGLTAGYQGKGHKTVLPRQASAKIDFRLVPNQKPEEIIRLLRRHLDRHGFSDIKITDSRGYPPAQTSPKNHYVNLVKGVQERVYHKPVVIEPLSAASGPIYLFTPLMPCISIGIGYAGSNIHAPNENIRLRDLWLGINCISEILKTLAQD